jgi:hypothetical protein
MPVSKASFLLFSETCRDFDFRGVVDDLLGAPRTDQVAASTNDTLAETIGLRSPDDAEKVLFGIYIAREMLQDAALALQVIGLSAGDPSVMTHVQALEETGPILVGAGSVVLSAQRSIAERGAVEEIFSEDSGQDADLILELAQEIRRVDGNHDLGAAALAEALAPFIRQQIRDGGP